jgi:uncharacterized protein (DUF2141 family)
MKRTLLVLLVMLAASSSARAAELAITVEGIRSAKGDIRLSIYGSAAEWPDRSARDHDQVQPAKLGNLTFKFEVPPGTYAAAGFHDENANGKFDQTLIGLPEEGYMFSNNVRPILSTPSFSSASFTVPPEGKAISIVVKYP